MNCARHNLVRSLTVIVLIVGCAVNASAFVTVGDCRCRVTENECCCHKAKARQRTKHRTRTKTCCCSKGASRCDEDRDRSDSSAAMTGTCGSASCGCGCGDREVPPATPRSETDTRRRVVDSLHATALCRSIGPAFQAWTGHTLRGNAVNESGRNILLLSCVSQT